MGNLRDLPQVDALARDPRLESIPRQVAVLAARKAVAQARDAIRSGAPVTSGQVGDSAARIGVELARPGPAQVINLSGIVLHTGLGRARLARTVAARVAQVAQDHAAVEFDLDSGTRGDRQEHVRWLLQELTSAEDALVVNNGAGAILLALAALPSGSEVVLSRGQMVEIGGAFRMPEIIEASGRKLVEVGCTNKTRLSDYAERLGPETAAILRCHPSNFAIVGFVAEPAAEELAKLAQTHGVPLIDDAGSGCLLDTTRFGLAKEPTLGEALRAGASIVTCSGDKLLGGPQAGLLLGSARLIAEAKKHPLARALRVDKLTLAALQETLRLYLEDRALDIPVWRYLAREIDEVRKLAERIAGARPGATVEEGRTEVGGGSLPGRSVPTWRVRLPSTRPDELMRALRVEHGVIGRIEDGAAWLDPRTLDEEDLAQVEMAVSSST